MSRRYRIIACCIAPGSRCNYVNVYKHCDFPQEFSTDPLWNHPRIYRHFACLHLSIRSRYNRVSKWLRSLECDSVSSCVELTLVVPLTLSPATICHTSILVYVGRVSRLRRLIALLHKSGLLPANICASSVHLRRIFFSANLKDIQIHIYWELLHFFIILTLVFIK